MLYLQQYFTVLESFYRQIDAATNENSSRYHFQSKAKPHKTLETEDENIMSLNI